MSTALADVQALEGKDVIVHLISEENPKEMSEIEGKVEKATIAGVAFRIKGKAGIELLAVEDGVVTLIDEIVAAPVKPKSVTQKKIQPIPEGQMRQHLADRHGISLKWCRDASEADAVTFHDSIDHADQGHKHEAKTEKPADERESALADESATDAGESASS